jgi:hypothetical protein
VVARVIAVIVPDYRHFTRSRSNAMKWNGRISVGLLVVVAALAVAAPATAADAPSAAELLGSRAPDGWQPQGHLPVRSHRTWYFHDGGTQNLWGDLGPPRTYKEVMNAGAPGDTAASRTAIDESNPYIGYKTVNGGFAGWHWWAYLYIRNPHPTQSLTVTVALQSSGGTVIASGSTTVAASSGMAERTVDMGTVGSPTLYFMNQEIQAKISFNQGGVTTHFGVIAWDGSNHPSRIYGEANYEICPGGEVGVFEGEPICYEGYDDVYNSGCNAEPHNFSQLWPNEHITVCGTSGVYWHTDSWYRDTDWYQILIDRWNDIWFRCRGEFPFYIFLLDANQGGCDNPVILYQALGEPGVEAEIHAPGLEPGLYWLWVGPASWDPGIQCGVEYVMELEGFESPTLIETRSFSWSLIKSLYK